MSDDISDIIQIITKLSDRLSALEKKQSKLEKEHINLKAVLRDFFTEIDKVRDNNAPFKGMYFKHIIDKLGTEEKEPSEIKKCPKCGKIMRDQRMKGDYLCAECYEEESPAEDLKPLKIEVDPKDAYYQSLILETERQSIKEKEELIAEILKDLHHENITQHLLNITDISVMCEQIISGKTNKSIVIQQFDEIIKAIHKVRKEHASIMDKWEARKK